MLTNSNARTSRNTTAMDSLELIYAFGKRLGELLDTIPDYPVERALRASSLATRFEVSVQTARKWLKGDALPNPVTLIAVAQYLNVSLDYLLSGVTIASDPRAALAKIPVFMLNDAASASEMGSFVQDGTMYCDPQDGEDDTRPRAWVRNWIGTLEPAFTHSDLILLDLMDTRVIDDAIFLVRSETLTSWRHVFVPLTGDAVFRFTAKSGRQEESVIPISQIEVNTTGDINARPSQPHRVMLVGRAIAVLRNIGFAKRPVV